MPSMTYCSFCGKSRTEVVKLIAGPNVYICNECVDLMHGMLHDPRPTLGDPMKPAQLGLAKEDRK